ncbi:MAG: hypothetical protein ABGW50_08410 [Thermococcus sp.]
MTLLTKVLAILLLLAFPFINLTMTMFRLAGRLAGATLRRALHIDVLGNQKKTLERLFTPIWIIVGLYGAWKVRWDYLAMVFAFLAFRSGANVSRTLVYSVHDGKIIEKYTSDSRVLGIIGKAVKVSLLLEGTFVVAFALAYKALSLTTTSTGTSATLFVMTLWLVGLIFGAIFGWFIARNNEGILLEDQITVVLLFAGKKGKEKTEETIDSVLKTAKGFGRHRR